MNVSPTRLKDLIAFADDNAGDLTLSYQTLAAYRDIADALRVLLVHMREQQAKAEAAP